MTVRLTQWRGALPRAVLLAAAVTLVPLPVTASEGNQAPKKHATIQAALQQAAAREAAKAPLTRVPTRRAEQGTTSTGSTGFFKSGPGMIALAVMALGTGYAIYSAKHDKINSPAKQ